ncbi:MAG TPA: hypothetical protein ENJ18_05785, partial [Nannocystis exedens]|nr:hypothetical protein [Nannocystis exedens]
MRSWLTTILVTLPLALPGCRTSGTVTPIVGGAPGSDGRVDQPLVVDPPSNSLYVGPAHVFTPRAHPSHARPMPPPPPDLRTLPRLVNRIDQCSGRSKPAKSRRPITTTQKSNKQKNKYKKKKRAPKYKHVPYGSQPVGTVANTSTGKGSGGLMGGSSDSGG